MSYIYLSDEVKQMRKEYADIEYNDYPPEFKKHVTARVHPKDCYRRAIKFILTNYNPDYKLIHGIFMDLYNEHMTDKEHREAFGHAWVEIEPGVIFDGVFNRFYREHEYLERRNIKKYQEWKAKQVLEAITKYNSFDGIHNLPCTQYDLTEGI